MSEPSKLASSNEVRWLVMTMALSIRGLEKRAVCLLLCSHKERALRR
jgi:hypothetical protein